MKAWNKSYYGALGFLILLVIVVNIFLFQSREENIPNEKIVEINRVYKKLQNGEDVSKQLGDQLELKIVHEDRLNLEKYMESLNKRIIVLPGKGNEFYFFTYSIDRIPSYIVWGINLFFFLAIVIFMWMHRFVAKQVIQPFYKMKDMAEAISRRDFDYPLPQQKYKFFGKFVWAIDMMRDELRYHEQKELDLMKEKKVMISSLSHDIKTPLSNIRLYNAARKDALYPVDTIMERVDENCDKIDAYVKDIINTSNEDLFDFSIHKQETYLHEILPILKREEERITLSFVEYEQQGFHEDCFIYADINRLKEVMDNIMDNALKYGDGKWIHVSFYEEDHHIIVKITNSGVGIQEQDQSALFQSFYRGNNVGKQKGNGLGLYICKQLMVKMGGDIFMSQEEGSVSFHLVLEKL
ncbi:MAG: HAMP domain-containing sensor histidine kinase [Longicatena sp.]